MKTTKLFVPLALLFCALISFNSFAANHFIVRSVSGIPFTAGYLARHANPNVANQKRLAQYIGLTYFNYPSDCDDWTITMTDGSFTNTWRTTDLSQGEIVDGSYQFHYDQSVFDRAGTYNITIQSNCSIDTRNDVGYTDAYTGDSQQDVDPYDNAIPFTVTIANENGLTLGASNHNP